jgi:hypothetical protein
MGVVAGEGGTAEVRMVLSSLPETIRPLLRRERDLSHVV